MSHDSPTFSSTHPAHILASLNLSANNNRGNSNGNNSNGLAHQGAGPSTSSSSSQLFFPSGSNQPYYTVDPYNTTHAAAGTGTSAASGLSPAASSTGSVRSQSQAGNQASASGAKTKRKGKEAQGGKSPTAALDGEDDDDGEGGGEKKKRRRRVVVACDTCRRKKVKCRGLPNATSTCDNCTAYNYKCTFSADQDRSRGKYEILESKAETLLAALRSVAPHLAEEYERGQLNITGPSGSSRHPNEDWTGLERAPQPAPAQTGTEGLRRPSKVFAGSAPAGPRLGASAFEVATILPPLPAASRPSLPSIRSLAGPFHAGARIGPMVPDLEDGRPRFYGRSSTLSHFHALDSRPPSVSPPPEQRSNGAESAVDEGTSTLLDKDIFIRGSTRPGSGTTMRPPSSGLKRGGAINNPATPKRTSEHKLGPGTQALYPSNSREWVHLLRRKNTVAVGRDDICSDEWFTRHMLPSNDLVFHLLDDIYFPHLHPLLPIIHPPTFRRDIRNNRASHDTAFRGLVFCIMTISSRFSDDPRVLADPEDPFSAGDHWAAGSRLYHQAFAASLINVQVLLLTATFMHASIGPGSSWTILGTAIRALQDIGLHQERANADFTPFDQEMRRRTFWSIFILDCIFAVCLGRPNALQLDDCNVHLPLDVSDEELSECESSGQPMATSSRASDEVKIEAKDGETRLPRPGVASGFRHMVKLNLLVHDVVKILYSHRRTSGQPDWLAHPGVGPVDSGGEQDSSRDDDKGEGSKGKNKGAKSSSLKKPEYKAMAQLCKRLDEWVAETPEHLQDLATSPFKLQAGIVSCGRHDIRLYILKPFLPDPFLYNMLRPQCTAHARACLTTVLDLYEGGHLNNMVFVFTQAFMSAVTFLLTVWHVTQNVKDLLPDAGLIERTAMMMTMVFDDRYCSAVFKKAWRVLQRIATRLLPALNGEQRARLQQWAFKDSQSSTEAEPSVTQEQTGYSIPQASTALSPSGLHNASPLSHERRGSTYNQTASGTGGPYNVASSNVANFPGSQGGPSGIYTRTNGPALYPWQAGGTASTSRSGAGAGASTRSLTSSRPGSGATSPTMFTLEHWKANGGLAGNQSRGQSPTGHNVAYTQFAQRLLGSTGSVTGQGFGTTDNTWPQASGSGSGFQSYNSPSRDRMASLTDPFSQSNAEVNYGDANGILGTGSGGFGTDDVNLDFFKLFEMAENDTADFQTSAMSAQLGGQVAAGGGAGAEGGGKAGEQRSDAWQEDFLQFLSGFDLPTNVAVSDLTGRDAPAGLDK
ncbi:hypothetical protein BCV69DRAFT_281663 [Microstroma glucosiphilum]|uniref:Zn(2)-C6 fungal-type domain-containing protein n=1 Tax=Pseudomicrostroma glucosiphilum TaxID=1684307 RepID=A0A316UA89_9BASI|nr:hypothetical protein BCV69DRAFT_281663 [Pseudomicrostroma glucosiphilum]PWN21734.1 hypothetical protein BCV69DRAFT_281663 [Pseudomicrostroma glucosiphilum]